MTVQLFTVDLVALLAVLAGRPELGLVLAALAYLSPA
ncbi:hypothetical protein B0G77_3957 [Paraburkholderia sp. BL10I2N1]|nr:hypothetical protein B0G77_3957 [Paraburkholderia sp. BL10I2N1]